MNGKKKTNKKAKLGKPKAAGRKSTSRIIKASSKGQEEIKKVRINDLSTGRLMWIEQKDLKAYNRKKKQKEERVFKKQVEELSDYLDIPEQKVKGTLYENIDNSQQIEKLIKDKKLRDKNGKFLKKETEEQILKFAQVLDREGVDYNLEQLMSFPEIEKKVLITKDEVPKELFYWNLQHKVKRGSFGNPVITIKDFDGKVIYKGESLNAATTLLNKASRKIKNIETVIEENEDTNPYFTIPIYETKRNGEVLKIDIDFSEIQGRMPEDLMKKYRTML